MNFTVPLRIADIYSNGRGRVRLCQSVETHKQTNAPAPRKLGLIAEQQAQFVDCDIDEEQHQYWIDRKRDHDERCAADARDRLDVTKEIIWQLFVERRIDEIARGSGEQCVSVRRSRVVSKR